MGNRFSSDAAVDRRVDAAEFLYHHHSHLRQAAAKQFCTREETALVHGAPLEQDLRPLAHDPMEPAVTDAPRPTAAETRRARELRAASRAYWRLWRRNWRPPFTDRDRPEPAAAGAPAPETRDAGRAGTGEP